jgi:hypothetical protein
VRPLEVLGPLLDDLGRQQRHRHLHIEERKLGLRRSKTEDVSIDGACVGGTFAKTAEERASWRRRRR